MSLNNHFILIFYIHIPSFICIYNFSKFDQSKKKRKKEIVYKIKPKSNWIYSNHKLLFTNQMTEVDAINLDPGQ